MCLYCMHWLFGILVYLYAHLSESGWSEVGLGLPTWQGTLPSFRTEGGVGSRREMGGGEEVEILNSIIYKAIKN